MTAATRHRISVDLRGLKAVLIERARLRGVSPSDFVRLALADALGQACNVAQDCGAVHAAVDSRGRTRASLRMDRGDAAALISAARAAGLPPGSFVAGLVAGVPALEQGFGPKHHVAALVASNVEMSTLARNVHHLTALLRQGSVRAAQEYQAMLASLEADVRSHLVLASDVLVELRPRRATATQKLLRSQSGRVS
jgi:hypothetical protein